MRIFLSYASEDRPRAEEVALALQANGHELFFDRTELEGGEAFHRVIREQIATADRLVFLISPDSMAAGSYCLTELRMARERWPHPRGRVLPVMLEPTPMERVPAYLRSVTILEPEGNVAAEVAARLPGRRLGAGVLVAAALAVVLAAAGIWLWVGRDDGTAAEPFVPTADPADFVSDYVLPADLVERTDYEVDPSGPFSTDRGDFVTLARVAFGALPERGRAFRFDVAVTNHEERPIQLDLSHRFFSFEDDRGQRAELVWYCCRAEGEVLAPGATRRVQLLFVSGEGWEGKELAADLLCFRIRGLLPLVRGAWCFRPLATAA